MIKYRMMALLKKPVLHCILIALLGLIVYSNTFNAPFQWDEGMAIIDNPIVKDLRYFLHPSEAKGFGELYYSLRDRYMGYLTFAINYRLHGRVKGGYHVVNITLHILNSLLVYALIRLTLKAMENLNPSHPPLNLRGGEGGVIKMREGGELIALFVGLIFVSHPIQTEAVTYIMGRLPLLMWFFYLSSMVLYAKWRLTPLSSPLSLRGDRGGSLYLLSLLTAVLAMKTKENALTLPFSIALYEFLFFDKGAKAIASGRSAPRNDVIAREGSQTQTKQSRSLRNRVLYLLPFALTLLIVPLSLMSFDKPVDEVIGSIESASRHYTATPRMSYLFTQFRVLVTYLRLLFLPVNQNFYYDYPVYNSFLTPQVFLSFLFLLSISVFGVYLLIRSRKENPALRLLAWGIFWFFLTLSVESSIFPIPMIISEYRMYAPSMGIILAVVSALVFFVKARRLIPILAAIVIVLSGAAYARNIVWRSNISLWEDVVRKSPENSSGHYNLGIIYLMKPDMDKARKEFETVLQINPHDHEAQRLLKAIQ